MAGRAPTTAARRRRRAGPCRSSRPQRRSDPDEPAHRARALCARGRSRLTAPDLDSLARGMASLFPTRRPSPQGSPWRHEIMTPETVGPLLAADRCRPTCRRREPCMSTSSDGGGMRGPREGLQASGHPDAARPTITLTGIRQGRSRGGTGEGGDHADLRRHPGPFRFRPSTKRSRSISPSQAGMPAEPPTEMHEYEPPDEIVEPPDRSRRADGRVPGARARPLSPQAGRRFRVQGPARSTPMSPFAALNAIKGKPEPAGYPTL